MATSWYSWSKRLSSAGSNEKTISPYLQINNTFDLFTRPAHIVAGFRYERTKVKSSALVPVPTGTQWVADNEFGIIYGGESDFTTFKGEYDHWLPAIEAPRGLICRLSCPRRSAYTKALDRLLRDLQVEKA